MKVVIDTNVFLSGVFFGGLPYQILSAWRERMLSLAYSLEILDEYRKTGARLSRRFEGLDLDPFLALVVTEGELFASPALDEAVCEDPEDDKFFACAVASRCRVIVSGGKHLLNATGYDSIEVLRPRAFVESYL